LIKDLKTKEPLLQGLHRDGLYHLPPPSNNHKAFLTTASSHPPWHHILGHPNNHVMRHLISFQQIKHNINKPCISCSISKSHKLPFTISIIKSTRPLEIIYSDVWGPAPIRSLDGYLYSGAELLMGSTGPWPAPVYFFFQFYRFRFIYICMRV
jgi:histone deacetylase 1/2